MMNITVVQGIMTFIGWSIFSTWYYVNFIKEFEPVSGMVSGAEVEIPGIENKTADAESMAESITVIDESKEIPEEESLAPISISKNFTFFKNSAEPIEPLKLQKFRDSLEVILNNRKVTISIVGHTCDLGTEKYNMNLAQNRANYIATSLKIFGEQSVLEVESRGESDPAFPNINETNRVKNRRVTITIKSQP